VTLEWQRGIGAASVTAGGDGAFTVGLLVLLHDQLGLRNVHARGFSPGVVAPFLVEANSAGPRRSESAIVFRR
jgi:hypothetical protein